MNPKLIVVEGEASQDEIQVKLPMTIGRVQGNGLVIAHPLVSRKHCEIVKRDDWLWVKDHGSANGTYIGDKQIQGEAVLRPGDRLKVGPLTFVAVYQQQGLIPPRIQAKKTADAAKGGKGDSSDSSISGVSPAPGKPNGASGTSKAPANGDAPSKSAARKAPPTSAAKMDGPPPGATSSPLPPAAKAPSMAAPVRSAPAKPAPVPADDDPFAAWARGEEKKSEPQGDDLVDRLEAAANLNDFAAELLANDKEGEETLDSDDVLAFEEAVTNYDDPGQTLVHGANTKEKYTGPVGLTAETLPLPPEEGSSIDQPALGERPSQFDVLVFHLLNQSERLQGQLLENHQQAVITAEVVNKLQQEQLDQIREQMDRLHELTKALQRAILTERPDVKRVFEFDDLASILPASPPDADSSDDNSKSSAMELNVEQLHQMMRKRMAASKAAEQDHWEKVRQLFRTHGLG